MRQLVDVEAKMSSHGAVLEDIYQKLARGEEVVRPVPFLLP
jgi:hypothetical protein